MIRTRQACWLMLLAFALGGCMSENPRVATRLNESAALTGDLPFNPLRDKVITSWIEPQSSTMSTLFGNDLAIGYARSHAGGDYPAGSVLSVITWSRQEDPRWFGGNIPGKVKSVEFVSVGAGTEQRPSFDYQRYEGAPLKKTSTQDGAAAEERTRFLLSQRAAVMP
jgi:hypothetical protein